MVDLRKVAERLRPEGKDAHLGIAITPHEALALAALVEAAEPLADLADIYSGAAYDDEHLSYVKVSKLRALAAALRGER